MVQFSLNLTFARSLAIAARRLLQEICECMIDTMALDPLYE